jgi:baculoviral IAP repeat-containing protein 6
VGKGRFFFNSKLQQHGGGDAAARLRRMTKEISSLPSQLPIDWDSSILVAVDENRLDALRAVIFPHKGSPYAHGAFAFDILLPPEYPNRPPQVQFLTTGGGRVRFK